MRTASGNWEHVAVTGLSLFDDPDVGAMVVTSRNVTPLQSLWPWSVVLQSLAVLLVLHLASRPMARQRPEARDPLAVAAAVAGAVALAVALGENTVAESANGMPVRKKPPLLDSPSEA